jgi:hypothetical protein
MRFHLANDLWMLLQRYICMHYSINSQIESSYVSDRQCLLCETCFWSATIIRSTKKMQSLLIVVLFVQIVIFLLFRLQMMMRTNCMLDQMVVWK